MNDKFEQRVAWRTQALRAMTQRYMTVQESENHRLARELHDKVSSSLTAIHLNLGLVQMALPEAGDESIRARLSDIIAMVKDTMASARNISADLHPPVLDYGGVVQALRDYGKAFTKRTGIAVEVFSNEEDLRFTPEIEIALYRISQEALNNCLKHADARSVSIALLAAGEDEGVDAPRHATLTIKDDGNGFDPAELGEGSIEGSQLPGLGLFSLRERADAVGGKFTLETAPGKGTTISVEVQRKL